MSNFQIIGRIGHPEPIKEIPGAENIELTFVGARPTVTKKGMTTIPSKPPVFIFFPEDSILPFATDVDLGKLTGDKLVPEAARDVGRLTDFLTKLGKNGTAKKSTIGVRRYLGQFSMGLYLRVDAETYLALHTYITERVRATVLADTRDPSEVEHIVDEVSITLDPEALGVRRKADDVEDACTGGGAAGGGSTLPKARCPLWGPSAYDLENARNKGFFDNVARVAQELAEKGLRTAVEVTEKIEGMNARIAVRYAGDTPGNDPACFEAVYGTRNRWVSRTHTQRQADGTFAEVPTPFAQAIADSFNRLGGSIQTVTDQVTAILTDMHGGALPLFQPGQTVFVLFGEVYGHFWRGKGEGKVAFRYDLPDGQPLGFRAFDLWVADDPVNLNGHWWDLKAIALASEIPLVPLIYRGASDMTLTDAVRYAEGSTTLCFLAQNAFAYHPVSRHIREGAVYRLVYDMGSQAWRAPGMSHLVRQPTMRTRHGECNLVAKIPGEDYLALKYGG